MTHVVIYKTEICPKCLKEHIGAAVAVLDFYACTDCFYNKYKKELQPKITEMIREYFQPERPNNEDAVKSVCDGLNSMET